MRTFFDIVLGILLTVVKTCLYDLASPAGVVAFLAIAVLVGVYAYRRRSAA